jgi:hypothetical protein
VKPRIKNEDPNALECCRSSGCSARGGERRQNRGNRPTDNTRSLALVKQTIALLYDLVCFLCEDDALRLLFYDMALLCMVRSTILFPGSFPFVAAIYPFPKPLSTASLLAPTTVGFVPVHPAYAGYPVTPVYSSNDANHPLRFGSICTPPLIHIFTASFVVPNGHCSNGDWTPRADRGRPVAPTGHIQPTNRDHSFCHDSSGRREPE